MFSNGGYKMYWHLLTYLSTMEISFYSCNIYDMNNNNWLYFSGYIFHLTLQVHQIQHQSFFPNSGNTKFKPSQITRLNVQTWFISKRDSPYVTSRDVRYYHSRRVYIILATYTRRMCVQTETVRQVRGERIDRPWVYWLSHSQVGSLAPVHT